MKRTPMPPRQKPMARTGFRRTGVDAGEGFAPVRRIRTKTPQQHRRQQAQAEYKRLRAAFLADATCARCGTTEGLTVQHLRGRVGAALCDVDGFLAMCWPCHSYAELHRAEAIAKGWALSRLARGGAA